MLRYFFRCGVLTVVLVSAIYPRSSLGQDSSGANDPYAPYELNAYAPYEHKKWRKTIAIFCPDLYSAIIVYRTKYSYNFDENGLEKFFSFVRKIDCFTSSSIAHVSNETLIQQKKVITDEDGVTRTENFSLLEGEFMDADRSRRKAYILTDTIVPPPSPLFDLITK